MCTELGRIGQTCAEQVDEVTTARARRQRDLAFRRVRTLCEDADELLGQAAAAARNGDAGAATEPLGEVRDLVTTILRALRLPAIPVVRSGGRPSALDEDEVMMTLALVEDLDSELRDAGIGYRDAGHRAGQLAVRILMAVDTLIAAVASGRTRSHASCLRENWRTRRTS